MGIDPSQFGGGQAPNDPAFSPESQIQQDLAHLETSSSHGGSTLNFILASMGLGSSTTQLDSTAPSTPPTPPAPGVYTLPSEDNFNGDASTTWPDIYGDKTTTRPPPPSTPPGPPPMDINDYDYPVKVSGTFDNTTQPPTITVNYEVEVSYYYNFTYSYSATPGSGEGWQADSTNPMEGNWHLSQNMETLEAINPTMYHLVMMTMSKNICEESYKQTQKITQQEQEEYPSS